MAKVMTGPDSHRLTCISYGPHNTDTSNSNYHLVNRSASGGLGFKNTLATWF